MWTGWSLNLGDVTHTRQSRGGQKPGITTKEILVRSEKTVTKFIPPIKTPTDDEKRKLFSIALEVLILETMQNHIYTFNGEIRKQIQGGAIGNILTGSLATLYMLHWERIFKQRLIEATEDIPSFSLYLSQIYVDDKNISCEALPLGSCLINGKIEVLQDKIENDRNIPADIRTSKIICELGKSISSFIKLTVDCPSMNLDNNDGWMPILDIAVKAE